MSKINDLIKELCPDGVEKVSLGSLMKRKKEKNFDSSGVETVYSVTKENGIVKSDDLHDFSVYSNDLSNYYILRLNQYAYNPARLNIGSIARLKKDEPGLVSPMYIIFELDSSKIDYEYYEYLLFSKKVFNDMCSFVEQGARFRFDYKKWDKILIDLPPLQVQKEIVKILNKFKALEKELQSELEMRKSQYEFWRGSLFKQDIDKMVTLETIGDVTKLAGFEFSEYVNYSDDGNIIALRGLNVKNGHLVLDDVKYVDNSDFSKLNRSKLYENDILYTYVGTVGQVGLVDKNDKYYLAPNVARIRIFDEKVNPKYVMHYMLTNEFKANQLDALSGTSSMKNITMTNIRKFKIPVPSLEKQNRIVNILDKFDKLVNDITVGLPAEIELRRKQYEYYRNKLLSFEELSVSE